MKSKRMTVLLGLLLTIVVVTNAQDLPSEGRKAIEDKFPNARINEVEEGVWKGKDALEVDLKAADGKEYEVMLSKSGEILNIEKEDGVPLIGGRLSVGIAGRFERDIYRDSDTEFEPTFFFLYENGPLEILSYDDFSAVLKLYKGDWFSVGLSGTVGFEEGYDADDNDYFDGMDKLSTLYGVGLEVEFEWGKWELGLEFSQDISGEHDGQEVDLTLTYTTMLWGFELRPEIGVTWMSSKVVDYFYGVSATEARPDRAEYKPGSSFEVEAGILILRPIGAGVTLVGKFGVSTVGSEIKDSPLVDRDFELEATLGIMYTF